MIRIGRVLHLTPSGMAVLKAENTPRIGDKVLDEKLRLVGTVFDIFGSVDSPYVEVKIDEKNCKNPRKLINRTLYVSQPKGRRKMMKGKRRKGR